MKPIRIPFRQKGVTLVIGLIMLVLITLVITTAFSLSTTNLRAVGNMQARDESLAAANAAIEYVVASNFQNSSTAPASQNVDIDNNGTNDYTVSFTAPTCVRAVNAIKESISSVTLGAGMSSTTFYNTTWEVNATVVDNRSGASVNVKQGIRVLISGTAASDATARTGCGIT